MGGDSGPEFCAIGTEILTLPELGFWTRKLFRLPSIIYNAKWVNALAASVCFGGDKSPKAEEHSRSNFAETLMLRSGGDKSPKTEEHISSNFVFLLMFVQPLASSLLHRMTWDLTYTKTKTKSTPSTY